MFLRKFRRGVQRHGIIGLMGVAADRIGSIARNLRPSVRAEARERARRAEEFDAAFGVDTGGLIHPSALALNHPNQLHAVSYRGSDPKYFTDAIASLPVDERFVFVDFGSGKGRALLLARKFPFKRIIGVEFSEELHRIAEENIRRFPKTSGEKERVECVCLDATKFALPEDPLVCYFCNPFDAVIMEQMLTNIENSLSRNPRALFFVYYNPKEAHLFAGRETFRPRATIGPVTIWEAAATERQ
jgi:SAM-dependent methyltransferase